MSAFQLCQQNPGANASNICGWTLSNPMMETENCNLCRATEQTFIIIVYNNMHSTYQKFRNTIIGNLGVIRAYGNGEFYGMAKLGSIRCLEGQFPSNHGFGVLSFDNKENALKCSQAHTEIREQFWLGGVEMYIVPLCTPCKSPLNFCLLQMDLYDVKNCQNFVGYLNDLFPVVLKHNGLIIAGTMDLCICRGIRRPRYIFMVQWSRPEDFHNYNNEARNLLLRAGAACSSRIVFEIDPPVNCW